MGETECEHLRWAVLAGLDLADGLPADTDEVRKLPLREVALGADDPQPVGQVRAEVRAHLEVDARGIHLGCQGHLALCQAGQTARFQS